jgi:hypothetical protein
MFSNLIVQLKTLHPIIYCIAYGVFLSLLLVLCLILAGGFFVFYDYIFNKDQEPDLSLFIPFVLLPIAMAAGYPWSWQFFGKTNNFWIPGILGCIVLNGFFIGVLYVLYRYIKLPKKKY